MVYVWHYGGILLENFKKTISDIRENVNDIRDNMSESMDNLKQTGKRGVAHVIYGRTVMVVLMLLFQILLMLAFMGWYKQYMAIYWGGYSIMNIIVILVILNSEENPIYKIAWLVPVMLLPVFGTLFYVWAKLQPYPMLVKKRVKDVNIETAEFSVQDENVKSQLRLADAGFYGTAAYLYNTVNYPVYTNTETTYFPIGEDNFKQMIAELEKAEKFIFMEYFIVARGTMWETVLEILKRKAKEGVDVRFMYDGMCSLVLLPYSYPKKLEEYGIKCRMFSPVKPILSIHQNNRDHRKIMVIDGKVAFTGGINLADEYININSKFGHWKDTGIMLKGDAVRSFTLMFLRMWNIVEGTDGGYERYVRAGLADVHAPGYVIPYGDSPFDGENVGEHVYMDMLNQAVKYVHIMTPYLILDNEMMQTLKYAAKRGIDVKIIMPHIPDKKYAFWLARSYYAELIRAGVKIYEYTPGFVHAKVFVCDDVKATVGSINLDFRSLYLHFECGVYMYGTSAVGDIEYDYNRTLEKCQLITLDYLKSVPLYQKVFGSLVKILAPLM